MSALTYNSFLSAQYQFDNGADLLELLQATRYLLRSRMREFHFTIPIRMEDGKRRAFSGFRIQHNDARGPAKGGVCFHPMETMDSIRAQSMCMTWKTAVADLPLGGSKGGVVCNPHHLSDFEQAQNNILCYWSKGEGWAKLDEKMTTAFSGVSIFALRHKLSMRDSAYVISVDKVAKACEERGWI